MPHLPPSIPLTVAAHRPTASRPGFFWYLLSIPIFLISVIAAIFMTFVMLVADDKGGGFQADFVAVPGSQELFLWKYGLYYVVSKQQTLVEGDTPSRGDPSDILVTVRSKASGRAMPLLRESGKNDRTGRTTLTFNNQKGEAFVVTTAYRDGAPRPAERLTVTTGLSAGMTSKMIMAGLMLFLGLAGPIAFIVFIAVKRRRRPPPRVPPPPRINPT